MVSQTESIHPADAELLAALHAEAVEELVAINGHLRECAPCTARQRALADDEARVAALLSHLDPPAHGIDRPRYVQRARRRRIRRGLRIAAAAATLAVAAAAVVAPTSPARRWLFRNAPPASRRQGAGASPHTMAMASGIAVPPSRSLDIVFRHAQPHAAVEITRTSNGDITFRSRGGNAAYLVSTGKVAIDNAVPADEYQVDVPRAVQELRILVGTRVLLQWPEDSARRASASRSNHLHIPLGADEHE